MTRLYLAGPGIPKGYTVHIAAEDDRFWFTSFGTFRKADGRWVCDGRFTVEPQLPPDCPQPRTTP